MKLNLNFFKRSKKKQTITLDEKIANIKKNIQPKIIDNLCERVDMLERNQKDILKIINYAKYTDGAIYCEFQYVMWGKLSPLLRQYFCNRFNIDYIAETRCCYNPDKRNAHPMDCIGYTFDKYSILPEAQQ